LFAETRALFKKFDVKEENPMTKTLRMPFRNGAGKEVNLTLANPKDGITKAEVVATQALIIAKNLFSTTGGDLVSALDPSILVQETTVLA